MREIKFRFFNKRVPGCEYCDTGITSTGINSGISMALDAGYIIDQFTGKKDKKGIDIYENDVVMEGGNIGIIEFDKKEAAFVCRLRTVACGLFHLHQIEVIGNIHENKDLLEKITR